MKKSIEIADKIKELCYEGFYSYAAGGGSNFYETPAAEIIERETMPLVKALRFLTNFGASDIVRSIARTALEEWDEKKAPDESGAW